MFLYVFHNAAQLSARLAVTELLVFGDGFNQTSCQNALFYFFVFENGYNKKHVGECMVHATPKSQVGFKDLPLDHGALLDEIRSTRDCEECHCQVLSEIHEAAVQRLIQYSRDNTRGYANARFLNLTETGSNDGSAKSVKCQSEVTAHEGMRSMVEDLAQGLE